MVKCPTTCWAKFCDLRYGHPGAHERPLTDDEARRKAARILFGVEASPQPVTGGNT